MSRQVRRPTPLTTNLRRKQSRIERPRVEAVGATPIPYSVSGDVVLVTNIQKRRFVASQIYAAPVRARCDAPPPTGLCGMECGGKTYMLLSKGAGSTLKLGGGGANVSRGSR